MPRWKDGGMATAEPGVAHLPLDSRSFDDVSPSPGRLAQSSPELFAGLREHADAAGLRVLAWTVALHQTNLATQHPELASETCFGDAMTHGLCPAQPRVRRYVTDLVDAVAATGWFDDILLESIAYVPVGHGHPHELWAARFDPITRALLSLCFCDGCTGRAVERDIDVGELRAWVGSEVHRGWNGPMSTFRSDDAGDEAIGVLLGRGDLLEYVRMRLDVVAELARSSVEHAHAGGVDAWLSSPVWARPLWAAWMQGVDPGRLTPVADRYGLQAYYADPALVAREIDHALRFTPADKLVLMQTLMRDHHRTSSELLAKVSMALSAGIEEFTLYNYGMATEPMLGFVREVADLVGSRR